MKTTTLIIASLLLATQAFGQQNLWKAPTKSALKKENLSPRMVIPTTFSLYHLDIEKMKAELKDAPQRFSKNESTVVKFPDINGKITDYIIQEASVMEAELQAKFPEIRSYIGWQKNKPENSIRFSITPSTGISLMYFNNTEVGYMESYTTDNSNFISYKRKNLPKNNRLFECQVEKEIDHIEANNLNNKSPLISDGKFRTYRLALSATGEYTAFHGGTVANALAAMATTMTRVNGIYEKTISVTMKMIANNNLIVYTNKDTDPFTNGAPNSMISQNQTNTTSVIGNANYDIGHVFGTNSGGLAGLGVVCNANNKARGVTGSGAPINDPFDIDYVAHEMGHQFGANHTFRAATGSCSGNANNNTAYEPGSGTTIMAYAGICGTNNIQPNSDAYFHSASVREMKSVIMGTSDCAAIINITNAVPTADAGANYSIPKGTAFALTGVGTDADGDVLTYLWEQYDNTNNTQPPVSTATVGPIYRSLTPTTSPIRYFPKMETVLSNSLANKWEVTPDVARTINFSLLVNDNKTTGNQSAEDMMIVTVTNDGPFKMTSHSTNTEYQGNTETTINWNTAGTNTGTINTQNVQILLSKDNGANFDVILAENVPNNGSANVILPNETIASARIMVKAIGNIYFAVNSSAFSIKKATLSTNNNAVKAFNIYPNPSKNEVNINLNSTSHKAEYSIFDMSGRLVKKGSINKLIKLQTNDLASGNYIVKITLDNGEKFSEQLIIVK